MILENFRELYQFKELFWVWTQKEIRVRYKQSTLGGLWAILQPLSMMLIFTAVFGYFARIPTDGIPYPIFFYSALLPWTLFSTSISFAVPSLLNNLNLVTKVYFPREIFPLAAIGASFLDYLIASLLFLAMLLAYQIPLRATILYLPLLLAVQLLLMMGVSLLLAAVVVFFRDIRFVVILMLQLWMYLTPVVYPVSLVPERLLPLYMLNPMASLIDGYRRITILGKAPEWNYVSLSAAISLLLFILAYYYFKRAEMIFADII